MNAVLYRRPTAAAYLRWLRSLGVEYVVLTAAPPDYSARTEAKLVTNPRGPLRPVFRSGFVTIYRVPHPRPIVTGPGEPRLLALTAETLRLRVSRGGTYRIAVRWSPYWRASDGCLGRGADGMLRLRTLSARVCGSFASTPRTFQLSERPIARSALEVGRSPWGCPDKRRRFRRAALRGRALAPA